MEFKENGSNLGRLGSQWVSINHGTNICATNGIYWSQVSDGRCNGRMALLPERQYELRTDSSLFIVNMHLC
jgi:hypothetical protein